MLLIAASLASLAALASPPVPATALRADGDVIGQTSGGIQCKRYQYERSDGSKGLAPAMPCDLEWSEPVLDARTWNFGDLRDYQGRARNGLTFSQSVDQAAAFEKVFDSRAELTRITFSASLTTVVSHAGDTKTTLQIGIPFETTAANVILEDTFQVSVTGGGNWAGRAEGSVRVDCAEAPADGPARGNERKLVRGRDVRSVNIGADTYRGTLATGNGHCQLQVQVEVAARNSDIIKSDHRASVELHLEATITVPPCSLGGTVRDGIPGFTADPRHAIPGLLVELLDGDDAVIRSEPADSQGRYCFREVVPNDYTVRATLIDGVNDPPVFRTLRWPSEELVRVTRPVSPAEFSPDGFDISFASDDPSDIGRSEVAAVHREAARFVYWLSEAGYVPPERMGTFIIEADSDRGTAYTREPDRRIRISDTDTRWPRRNGSAANCPENCEWHEIGHHLEHQLDFARSSSAACRGRVNHGGWRNDSTCDSFAEGFPVFLALVGSRTLDADRGSGYATADYAGFGSLEHNGRHPWSMTADYLGDEDFAVSQVLWDLVDEAGERVPVLIGDGSGGFRIVMVQDSIQLDPIPLFGLLQSAHPHTVADLLAALQGSGIVDEAAKRASVDLGGNPEPDLSALEAVFLISEFHAVNDLEDPWYRLGDPVGATDRLAVDRNTGQQVGEVGQPLTSRNQIPERPGSAILLGNASGASVMFTVEVTYPETSSRWELAVDAGAEQVFHLELPPYWRGWVDPTAALPECGGADHTVVTINITAPGLEPTTIESCEYQHAVAQATGDHAVEVVLAAAAAPSGAPSATGPATSTGPDGAPSPTASATAPMVVGGAVLLVLGAMVVFLELRRRRGRATPSG